MRLVSVMIFFVTFRLTPAFPCQLQQGGSSSTVTTIFDGARKNEKVIEAATVKVQGQTSGEWVHLGTYSMKKDGKPFVEISNKTSDGIVVADAVLFVPVRKQ